jgi:hypothetical protein
VAYLGKEKEKEKWRGEKNISRRGAGTLSDTILYVANFSTWLVTRRVDVEFLLLTHGIDTELFRRGDSHCL